MTAAPRFLWPLAGRPGHGRKQVPAPAGAACLACGELTGPTATSPKEALGVSYDYSAARRRDAELVCEACAWSLAGRGLSTLRLWTVGASATRDMPPSHPKCALPLGPRVHLTNRADMRAIARLLTDPPVGEWLVTVAVSGQKHVLPYADTNHGPGPWRIRVETATVEGDPAVMAMLLGRVARLRAAGFGPDQIAQLDPGTSLSTRERLAAWREHADPIRSYRGSPILGLASLTPTKEHLDDYISAYPAV